MTVWLVSKNFVLRPGDLRSIDELLPRRNFFHIFHAADQNCWLGTHEEPNDVSILFPLFF